MPASPHSYPEARALSPVRSTASHFLTCRVQRHLPVPVSFTRPHRDHPFAGSDRHIRYHERRQLRQPKTLYSITVTMARSLTEGRRSTARISCRWSVSSNARGAT